MFKFKIMMRKYLRPEDENGAASSGGAAPSGEPSGGAADAGSSDFNMASALSRLDDELFGEETPSGGDSRSPSPTPTPTPSGSPAKGADGDAGTQPNPGTQQDKQLPAPGTGDQATQDVKGYREDRTQPPKTWSNAEKAEWANLSPAAREAVHRREADFYAANEANRPLIDRAKEYDGVMGRYDQLISAHGMTRASVVQHLMNAQLTITQGNEEQKTFLLRQIMKDAKLDPVKVFGLGSAQVNPNDPSPVVDPTATAIENHPVVKELRSTVENLQSQLGGVVQTDQQRRFNDSMATVEAFKNDPAHPHFDKVAAQILNLVQAGSGLAEAYQAAIWMHPETRQLEIDRLAAEKLKSDTAAAEAAKAAASGNVRTKSREGRPTPQASKNWEDDLSNTYHDIVNR